MATKDPNDMTFFEHLDALRPGLIRTAIVFVVAFVVAFGFKDVIMGIVMAPQSPDFVSNATMNWLADALNSSVLRINQDGVKLINTTMAGQFNMHISISFYVALIIGIPYLLFELWLFVAPALSSKETRGVRSFIFVVLLFLFTGVAFAYFVLAPLAINFLSGYVVSDSIINLIDASSYISTVLNLCLVCGVVFQLPIVVWFLSRYGIITDTFMRTYRRHAIIVLAIGSAIITPPDIVSMILVIIPLYGLYELSISIAAHNTKVNERE